MTVAANLRIHEECRVTVAAAGTILVAFRDPVGPFAEDHPLDVGLLGGEERRIHEVADGDVCEDVDEVLHRHPACQPDSSQPLHLRPSSQPL